MFEMTKSVVGEISNKELKKEVNAIDKAIQTGNKSQWDIAKAFHRISRENLFVDDFKTDSAFCKKIGIAQSNFSKMCKCVDMLNLKVFVDENDKPLFTISKMYEMSQIDECKIEEFLDFYEITPETTAAKIREYVKEWLEGEAIDRKDAEETEKTEKTEESIIDLVELKINAKVTKDCYDKIVKILADNGVTLEG